MTIKIKTTVRLPKATRQEMIQTIIANGYGMRGKSKWVSEAIHQLLAINNFHELVDIGDEIADLTEVESIYLEAQLKEELDKALILIRRFFPTMEGVQSCIIRTSIIQRLLRGN
jgi:hypothetical protein